MEQILAAIGAQAGSQILGPPIASGLSKVLPFIATEAGIPGAVALGTDMATGGTGASTLPSATGLFGIPSSTLGGVIGGGLGGRVGLALARGLRGPSSQAGTLPTALPAMAQGALPVRRGVGLENFVLGQTRPIGLPITLEELLRRQRVI